MFKKGTLGDLRDQVAALLVNVIFSTLTHFGNSRNNLYCKVHITNLLHTFCLPTLLNGLEAFTMSNANLCTLHVTWKTALYTFFHEIMM